VTTSALTSSSPTYRPAAEPFVLKNLYRVGAIAALITLLLIPIQAVVFIAWPPPITAAGYFALLQSNKLLGLLSLDLLYVVDNALLIPIFLALYVALRRDSQPFMALGLGFGLVGIASLFASNTAFDMLSLSDGYAAATTEAQKAMYLAAGQAMLATYAGTAYHVSYVLGSLAGIVVSAVMLRSRSFGKAAGYLGIISNVLGFGLYVPTIGVYLSLLSVVPFLAIWYALVALRLWRLGS